MFSGKRIGNWGRSFCLGDAVLRQFNSPCSPVLVLPGITTSPFVLNSARLLPEETRREHHSVRAIAVDQASESALGERRASRPSCDPCAIVCNRWSWQYRERHPAQIRG